METKVNTVQDVVFNFTGFGAFLTVTSNPTTELMEYLKKDVQEKSGTNNIGDIRILNVAAQDCKDYITEIMATLKKKEEENPQIKQVLIHMGVNAGGEKIGLEIHGYNNAHFRGADNRGYQPTNEKIQKCFPLEHYFKTVLPIEEICQALETKHSVGISNDPGRYVCNYIYYSSLCEGYKKDIPCIFIHVPSFDKIGKEAQQKFVMDFMAVTKDLLLKELQH